MSLSDRYQNFGTLPEAREFSDVIDRDSVEDAKLQSFEDGYQAGWDDAVKAHTTAKDRFAVDFAQNLQDMSFTYHEAYSKLSIAMQPLLTQIMTKVLPDMQEALLVSHIVTQITGLMREQSENAIEIAVSPENYDVLNNLLIEKTNIPFTIRSDTALGGGQVNLRVNKEEREINLDAVTSGISEALDAFFHEIEQEIQDV